MDADATILALRADVNRQPGTPAPAGQAFARFLPDGRPRVSPSQIMLVLECGEKWRRRYLEAEGSPSNSAPFYGTVFHAVMEDVLKEHMRTGHYVDPVEVGRHARRIGDAVFKDAAVMAALKDPEKLSNGYMEAAQELEVEAALAAIWLIQNEVTPLGCEETVVQSLNVGGQEIGNLGRYDGLVNIGGRVGMLDWKTSAKSPSMSGPASFVPKRSHAHAGLCYVDAVEASGRHVDDLLVVYVVRTKTPKVIQATVAVTPALLAWSRAVSEGAIRLIQSGSLVANPTGNMCNANFCEFWESCPAAALTLGVDS